MTKYILTFLSSCICLLSYSQIIDFADPNFKARLLESASGVPIAYGIFPNGGSFKIDANEDGEIEVDEVLLIGNLNVKNSGISDLSGIEFFTNLEILRCEENLLSSLDVTALTNLRTLGAYSNNLTSIDLTGLTMLQSLYCNDNELTSIDITTLTNLGVIQVRNNSLTSIDFSNSTNLNSIRCNDNQITNIDVSNLAELVFLYCSSNLLETLNVNNGYSEYNLDFSDNDNLRYICADAEQVIVIENQITAFGYTNCYVNSLCSYISGEDFYQISGQINYDEYENGCDLIDIEYPELMFSYSDGINTATTFADENGVYISSLQAGDYTFTPILENPTYFGVIPTNKVISFPEDANSDDHDFCVSPNGDFPDLEIIMDGDLSGYDTFVSYRIKYSNKGTMTQSGVINLSLDNELAVFSSAVPMISSQNTNELAWSFSDLKPFESRNIDFIMDLSAVQENMYGEMIVMFVASINSSFTDMTPSNNVFEFDEPFFCCLLNTVEYAFADYFVLFPNPTKDILNFKMIKDINIKRIELYTLLGQKAETMVIKNRSSRISIDVSNLESGHYFIKIFTSETIFTTRFLKGS